MSVRALAIILGTVQVLAIASLALAAMAGIDSGAIRLAITAAQRLPARAETKQDQVPASALVAPAGIPNRVRAESRGQSRRYGVDTVRIVEVLADSCGVSAVTIEAWYAGLGFRGIVIACNLSEVSGEPVAQIVARKLDGQNWGEIAESLLPPSVR